MAENVVTETNFETLKLFNRGKVRDIYDLGDRLLIITTDRISAFDVILPNGIPFKGKVLNQISMYWFKVMEDITANHIITCDVDEFPESCRPYADILKGRSIIVKKAEPLPVECVVRGYIAGSMWKEYKEKGGQNGEGSTVNVCGVDLPTGLKESGKLGKTFFTPATKAEQGDHDMNISFEKSVEILGNEIAEQAKDTSVKIYEKAVGIAEKKGIIIADTKFEFGFINGNLTLIDEICSPDSSRFWPSSEYAEGKSQPSCFDKQFVRDYLLTLDWDKTHPGPELPENIITQTSDKYLQAFEILTGRDRKELE